MRSGLWTSIGIAIAAALIASVGIALSFSSKSDQPRATGNRDKIVSDRIKQIEDLGDRVCLCAMAGRAHEQLTAALAKATAGLKGEGFGTSSLPMTGSVTCYPELSETACVGRIELVSDAQQYVCTEDQAKVLDAVWNAALKSNDQSTALGDAALIKRLEVMRADLRRTLPDATCKLP
jgi:hypothetical protein